MGRKIGRMGVLAACFLAGLAAGPGSARAQAALPYSADAWAKIVAAAKKEGHVTYYTAQVPFLAQRMAEGFKKAYPDIQIDFFRQSSGPLISKIEQERAGNAEGADVFVSTELTWYLKQQKAGQLLAPRGPATAQWPSHDLYKDAIYVAGIEPVTIVYNTQAMNQPPTGYADALDPKLKGRVGTSDLTATTVIAFYDWLEKTQDPHYLEKLKAQDPKFYIASTLGQAVASGEVVIGLLGNITGTKPLMAQGAPVGYIIPKGGFAFRYGAAALGWSKHPDAALVLLDYILSRDGQILWHGGGESASPLSNIPGSLDASTMAPWDPADYPPEVAKAYTDRWDRIMGRGH